MDNDLKIENPQETTVDGPASSGRFHQTESGSYFHPFAEKTILIAEVTDGEFKYITLRGRGKSLRTSSFGSFSALELVADSVDSLGLFNAGMDAVREKLGGRIDEIYLVSSDLDFFVRRLELPPLKKKEIRKAVSWEVDKLIPIPIDDSYLLIKKDRSAGDNLLITAGAVPRGQVDRWDYLGDKLKGVVPSSVALAALGPKAESTTTAYCYVYVEDDYLDIGFYNSDGLLYAHPIQVLAERLFDTGASGLPIRRIVEELINGIEVFYSYFPEITVKALALLTEGEESKTISGAISERLEIPVTVPDIDERYSPLVSADSRSLDNRFLPLLGAIRSQEKDFIFFPRSLTARRRFNRARKTAFYHFLASAVICALLGAYWFYDVERLEMESKNTEIIKAEMVQSRAYRQISSYREAASFLESLKRQFDSRSEDYSDLLKILSTITPDGIYLESVSVVRKEDKLNIRLTGYYDGNLSKNDIALVDFMESLNARGIGNLRLQRLGEKLSGVRKIASFQLDGKWSPDDQS